MQEGLNLRRAVKFALSMGAMVSAGVGVAFAQTSAPASSTSTKPTKLSEITVTGSHIPQTSVATSQPVVTITRAQIDASGFTNLGQVLQNLPSSGASFNNQSTGYIGPYNPSSGYFDFNLYNLGSQRVLILVNGKRWIPTLGGAVNLSSIPTAIISRIEVLLDGASAIYGSSAVSGVVNIITTKNYNGAQASAYLGEYDANGVGSGWDGRTQHYTATMGISNDRGSLLFSVGYRDAAPIWATSRNLTAVPDVGFPVSKTGTTFSPYGNYTLFPGGPNSAPPAACTYPNSCTGTPTGIRQWTNADRFNYQKFNYLTIPSESWHAYVQGHYDLSDNVTFNSTMVYSHRTTDAAFSPTPLAIGAFGFWYANGLPIGVSANNKYNPFGVDLVPALSMNSSAAQAWCSKYGSNNGSCGSAADLLIYDLMYTNQTGFRTTTYNSDSFYYEGGFNGYFTMFGNQWTWDASYVFARNRFNSELGGIQNLLNVQKALGPNCTGSCVPLNMFGTGQGITAAQRNYINTIVNNAAGVNQRIYSADIAGNFWNSWYAGPWGAAAGYQYLETDGFYRPDGFVSTGNLTTNAFNPTAGRIGQNAEYGEIRIPFARNAFLAKNLSLDLANRWTQFHVAGITGSNYEHASTGRAAFKWQPINQLLIRATWSQSFREPSVSELFSGQATSYNTYNDPCISKTGAPPTGTYNCPNPSPTAPYGQIQRISGGNAQLQPEKGTTRQIGFVWSPTFAQGLNIRADYYKAEVLKAVGLLNGQVIIDGCYLQNIQSDCSRLTRTGPRLNTLNDSLINTGSLTTHGWTFGLNYKFPTTSFGQFGLDYKATFVQEFTQCLVVASAGGSTSQCHDHSGSLYWPMPKHRMQASLDWSYGNWSAVWSTSLVGPMWERCLPNATLQQADPSLGWCSNPNKGQNGQNHLGTVVYHDVQASYTLNAWNTTFTVGCNNIFNKNSPISRYYGYTEGALYYRIPGRFFYGRVTVRF